MSTSRTTPHKTIGRYELINRLGLGGMAEVWVARQRSFGGFERLVALKRILPRYAVDRRFVEAFATEAHIAASLAHPHIAQIHDLEETQGELLIAMELVRGETLQAIVRRAWELTGQAIPPAIAVGIVSRVCRALHHAHGQTDLAGQSRGIVHRDIGPSNVLVGFRGEVKVVDFGIARALAGSTAGTGGKVAYLSPEQARGDQIDARSDLFAAGIVLWELLTGMRLYVGMEAAETRAAIGSATPARSAREARPGLDAPLDALVAKALAKDPRQRFQDGGQMADALDAWLRAHDGDASDEAIAALMGRLFRDRLEVWLAPDAPRAQPAPSIFASLADVPEEPAPRAFASLIEPLPDLSDASPPVDPTDPDELPASAEVAAETPPEPPAPIVVAPPPAPIVAAPPPPAPIVVAAPPPPAPIVAAAPPPPAPIVVAAPPPPAPIVAAPPPPAPIVVAPPPAPIVAAPPPVPKAKPIAAQSRPAARPVVRPAARGFQAPRGTSGHVLTMVGTVLFLLGTIALPWQHFELADLSLAGFELNLFGLLLTIAGGTTLIASAWGLITGRRHAAARYNVFVAIGVIVGMLVAATQLRWGTHLMAYEAVSLHIGFIVAGLGAFAILGGGFAVFAALPRWDASTSFLRLRLSRAGRPLQDLVIYEPRIVDITREASHPELLSEAPTLARLPRFRVTREGDTTVALRDPTSRVLLDSPRGREVTPRELDALTFNAHSRRGPGGDRWTRLRIGDCGSVVVEDTAVQFVFVKPIPGRAHVALTRWTESAALGLLVALLFVAGALTSILMWQPEAERTPLAAEDRQTRIEAIISEDKPAEEQPREVQVDIETPKAPEPEVQIVQEEKYGDDERVVESTEIKPRPTRTVERVTPSRGNEGVNDVAKEELMRRLLGPTEGSSAKLASVAAISNDGNGRLDAARVLDGLPGELPGFASNGERTGPSGPLAGDAADNIAKKLTTPPKTAGAVRGKVTGMKSATKVTGQLDPGQVYSVIDANIAKIQACYENRLQVDASLAGRITFRWTVTPTGSVTGVQQHTSTVNDPKVAACIKSVLERLRFPKPEGGSVEISYPFIFRSS